jgi:hypothetical protein
MPLAGWRSHETPRATSVLPISRPLILTPHRTCGIILASFTFANCAVRAD